VAAENFIGLNSIGAKPESEVTQSGPPSEKHDGIAGEVQEQQIRRKELGGYKTPADFHPTAMAHPVGGLMAPDAQSESPKADGDSGSHASYSLSDIWQREKYVLSGASETGAGITSSAKEAAKNWPMTALEVGGGLVIGTAMVLASRNPELAVPVRVINRTMMVIAAGDLASRVAVPSYQAVAHPELAEQERHLVGQNLGDAVFNYGMAVVAGGFGSRFSTDLVERTAIGSKIGGYEYIRTPGGSELRMFKSGNALVTRNGQRVFEQAASHLDEQLNPVRYAGSDATAAGAAESGASGGASNGVDNTIVGDNDKLRETFGDGPKKLPNWREGKDVAESAGKFDQWYESITSALATEFTERAADVGIGLLEHDYLKARLQPSTPDKND
jgi:hypothetical protein